MPKRWKRGQGAGGKLAGSLAERRQIFFDAAVRKASLHVPPVTAEERQHWEFWNGQWWRKWRGDWWSAEKWYSWKGQEDDAPGPCGAGSSNDHAQGPPAANDRTDEWT